MARFREKVLRPHLIILTIAITSLLSGCAVLSDYGCKLQENRTKTADLSTYYRPASSRTTYRPLTRGIPAELKHYKVAFNVERIEPCTTLSILKELNLHRNTDPGLQFKETREFYAEDGTLITSVTEEITDQLPVSGVYSAVVPLPIPRSAPPGKYHIVSKFTVERPGERRQLLLGTTNASFYIMAR